MSIFYSAQLPAALATLRAGRTHVQAWEDSRPYSADLDLAQRDQTRVAYSFLVSEYQAATRRPLSTAPIFMTPHRSTAVNGTEKKKGALVLVLDIPDEVTFVHHYRFFVQVMLEGKCWRHDRHPSWDLLELSGLHEDRASFADLRCSDACKTLSWRNVLVLPPEDHNRQVIVNELRPEWLLDVIEPEL